MSHFVIKYQKCVHKKPKNLHTLEKQLDFIDSVPLHPVPLTILTTLAKHSTNMKNHDFKLIYKPENNFSLE